MAMKKLATANVVVVANTFNVSIFDQMWLLKNEVFSEEEFSSGNCTFVPPGMSQIDTTACTLLVVPERLQFSLKPPDLEPEKLDKVRKVIELLPETPYAALGLNIVWDVMPSEEQEFGGFTRTMFGPPLGTLGTRFDTSDARFGSYMSRNFEVFRLKLDIKPAKLATAYGSKEVLRHSFNFHLELGNRSDKAEAIQDGLAKWDVAFTESEEIVDLVVKG